MPKSSLCYYCDTYPIASQIIAITAAGADGTAKQLDERNKRVIIKNYMPFIDIDCTSEINNTQIEYPKDLDVVMPMHKLTEYSHNYSKTTGSLWQHYRYQSAASIENSESFKSKIRITGKTPPDNNTKKYWNSSTMKILK